MATQLCSAWHVPQRTVLNTQLRLFHFILITTLLERFYQDHYFTDEEAKHMEG